jgi:hypothetical protein
MIDAAVKQITPESLPRPKAGGRRSGLLRKGWQ